MEKHHESATDARNDNSDLEEKWMQYSNQKDLHFGASFIIISELHYQEKLFNQHQ